MNIPLIVTIVILTIILIITLILILAHKKIATLKTQIDMAFLDMDNNFKERWILIPNLISILKRYMKNDQTLLSLIKLRNNLYNKKSNEEKMTINKNLETTLRKLFIEIKKYPELKTNKNFIDIIGKLNSIEKSIETSRDQYYEAIKNYNLTLTKVPYTLIAKLFKFSEVKIDINKD